MDRTLVFRQSMSRLLKIRNSLVLRLVDNILFDVYLFQFLTSIYVKHVDNDSKHMLLLHYSNLYFCLGNI